MSVGLAQRRLLGAGAAALMALALTACPHQIASSRRDVPIRPQVVNITMQDHGYVFDGQGVLSSGRATFRVANDGQARHDLIMVKLPDDVDGVHEWLDTDVSGFVPVYRMKERGPGERGVFSVDLEPGRYGLLCFVKDSEGEAHYKRGMVEEFRVHDSH